MKKAITIKDKKKKKDLADEVARLEAELDLKHKLELDAFRPQRIDLNPVPIPVEKIEKGVANVVIEDSVITKAPTATTEPNPSAQPKSEVPEKVETESSFDSTPGTPRLSRAQKRREKKSTQDRERQKRIEVETEILVEGSEWKKEDRELEVILKGLNLEVFDIPADGHW